MCSYLSINKTQVILLVLLYLCKRFCGLQIEVFARLVDILIISCLYGVALFVAQQPHKLAVGKCRFSHAQVSLQGNDGVSNIRHVCSVDNTLKALNLTIV